MRIIASILIALFATAACGGPSTETVCHSSETREFLQDVVDANLKGYFKANPVDAIPEDQLDEWADFLKNAEPRADNEKVASAMRYMESGVDYLRKWYDIYPKVNQHGFRFIAQGHYDLRRACSDLGVELM